jgi:flap endonuclease-1
MTDLSAETGETEHTEIQMSRSQLAITVAEATLWSNLREVAPSQLQNFLQSNASDLLKQSESMLEILQRRRAPPSNIYHESQLLIRAMGVPCLESPCSIEGEAYAASLAQHGFADCVASEDTVR